MWGWASGKKKKKTKCVGGPEKIKCMGVVCEKNKMFAGHPGFFSVPHTAALTQRRSHSGSHSLIIGPGCHHVLAQKIIKYRTLEPPTIDRSLI